MKKGASHLAFVLSFVIFITFLIFMYTSIEPTLRTEASKQSLLDLLRFSLVDKFYVRDLSIVTIINTSSITSMQDCISLQGILGTSDNQIPEFYVTNNYLIIKNEFNQKFNYAVSGGNLKIGTWTPGYLKENGYFLKIYYSEKLGYNPGNSGTGCNPTTDYKIGSLIEEQEQVFESNIFLLRDRYESDCGITLKNDMNIPAGNDFTFSFELADGSVVEPTCVKIPNTNVYATKYPLQYLDVDASLKIGFLTIKVW